MGGDLGCPPFAMPKTKKVKDIDVVSQIMAYEEGQLTEEQTLALFKHLVKTGLAWQLQGSYGRVAEALLDAGLI